MKLTDRDGKIYWSKAVNDKKNKNAIPYYITCFMYQGKLSVVLIVEKKTHKIMDVQWKHRKVVGLL